MAGAGYGFSVVMRMVYVFAATLFEASRQDTPGFYRRHT